MDIGFSQNANQAYITKSNVFIKDKGKETIFNIHS